MRKTLPQLLKNIRACTHCADALPCSPRPVVQAHRSARLRIVGQAPGRKVHETGIPWNDPSGDRLRTWLDLTPGQFYDSRKVAIIPLGFCYPGKAASGDNPPRPECAPRWHEQLNAHLPDIALTAPDSSLGRVLAALSEEGHRAAAAAAAGIMAEFAAAMTWRTAGDHASC